MPTSNFTVCLPDDVAPIAVIMRKGRKFSKYIAQALRDYAVKNPEEFL